MEGLINHSRTLQPQASQLHISPKVRRAYRYPASSQSQHNTSRYKVPFHHPHPKLRIASADEAANALAFEMAICNACGQPSTGPPGTQTVIIDCDCEKGFRRCQYCTFHGNVRLKCCNGHCDSHGWNKCGMPRCDKGRRPVNQLCRMTHNQRAR